MTIAKPAIEAASGVLLSPKADNSFPENEIMGLSDIVVLREGDRVPADAVLLSSTNLTVDESLLTGESVAVRKSPTRDVAEMASPGGEDLPFYS